VSQCRSASGPKCPVTCLLYKFATKCRLLVSPNSPIGYVQCFTVNGKLFCDLQHKQKMHRLTTAVGSVGRPLASKALQRTFASSPVKTQKQGSRFYSTPATSVVAEPFLNGTSSTYVEEMYESWLENPKSVHKVVAYFCLLWQWCNCLQTV